jgi:hypothetical protein
VLWAELGTPRQSPHDRPATSTVSWVGLTFVLTDASGPVDRRHPPGLLSIPHPEPRLALAGRRLGLDPAQVVISDAT